MTSTATFRCCEASLKSRPARMFQMIRFGALIWPSPRVGFAAQGRAAAPQNRIVVARGLETTRPFESVIVDGPNCGSAAAIRVTIGPLYGPERITTFVPNSRPHGAL